MSSLAYRPYTAPRRALSPCALNASVSLSIFAIFTFPVTLSSVAVTDNVFPAVTSTLYTSVFSLYPVGAVISFTYTVFSAESK